MTAVHCESIARSQGRPVQRRSGVARLAYMLADARRGKNVRQCFAPGEPRLAIALIHGARRPMCERHSSRKLRPQEELAGQARVRTSWAGARRRERSEQVNGAAEQTAMAQVLGSRRWSYADRRSSCMVARLRTSGLSGRGRGRICACSTAGSVVLRRRPRLRRRSAANSSVLAPAVAGRRHCRAPGEERAEDQELTAVVDDQMQRIAVESADRGLAEVRGGCADRRTGHATRRHVEASVSTQIPVLTGAPGSLPRP